MLYNGTQIGIGVDEDPLVKSLYIATWNDDVILPPPGSDLIITELGFIMLDENGENLITETA